MLAFLHKNTVASR